MLESFWGNEVSKPFFPLFGGRRKPTSSLATNSAGSREAYFRAFFLMRADDFLVFGGKERLRIFHPVQRRGQHAGCKTKKKSKR